MIVCLDTCFLIYAMQEKPVVEEIELHDHAQQYLKWLSREEIPVMLPTPVISEFLTGSKRPARLEILQALARLADVYDFDLRAATLASELRSEYWARHKLPKGLKRQVLTVDMMIAATAIVNNATMLITHDVGDFERVLDGRLLVRGIEAGPPGQTVLL